MLKKKNFEEKFKENEKNAENKCRRKCCKKIKKKNMFFFKNKIRIKKMNLILTLIQSSQVKLDQNS